MQFESKRKRALWLNVILGFVPDVLISIVVAAMGGGIVGFFFTLLGLQVVYFLVWAKKSIWDWVLFMSSGRQMAVRHIADYLSQNRYPEPDDHEKSAEGYLTNIIADENQPTDVRLIAAASLSELNFMSSQGQVQNHMRVSMAYEEALEIHKRTFAKAG